MNKIPQYEFRVLCRDGSYACSTVMNGMMKEFEHVEKVYNSLDSDHKATKSFKNITEAEKKLRELLQKYDEYIRTITIVPRD